MKIVVLKNGARGDAVCDALRKDHDLLTFPVAPVNSEGFVEMLSEWEPELGICAGYPVILKKPILGVPKRGWWNCHGGPVPEYRGGSPLNWQIIEGKSLLGVSLLVMDEGLDTGPVISREHFVFGDRQTIKDAHDMANLLFPKMVMEAIGNIKKLKPKKQGRRGKTYRQRSDADGEISLSWPPEKINNYVRALTRPYPGAWVRLPNGQKLRIWDADSD